MRRTTVSSSLIISLGFHFALVYYYCSRFLDREFMNSRAIALSVTSTLSRRKRQRRRLHPTLRYLSWTDRDEQRNEFTRKDSPFMAAATALRTSKYEELMEASRLSLAPMMEYTDRHFRHLVRLISSKTLLYTEMVSANAIYHERIEAEASYRSQHPSALDENVRCHFDDSYLLRGLGQGQVEPLEGPCVLQLGGSDPTIMYEAARTVMDLSQRKGRCNFTAINLNCGCPSPKVAGKGCFGAALMEDPALVAELTKALHDGSEGTLPVTVKCRIGTDSIYPASRSLSSSYGAFDQEEYSRLCRFVETVASPGVVTDFIVHARIAVLNKSFSPAENRKIPPLKYDMVRRLVQDYPDFTFTLNGGITSLSQAQQEFDACEQLNGVMVGRAWAADPWSFAMADNLLYRQQQSNPPPTPTTTTTTKKNRWQILLDYGRHADAEEARWNPVNVRRFVVKAVLPLFAGEANSKQYRIALDEIAGLPKKFQLEQRSLAKEPPISELILNAAAQYLSEEVLTRSAEESYERLLWEEKKRQSSGSSKQEASTIVSDWQQQRKMKEVESSNVANNA